MLKKTLSVLCVGAAALGVGCQSIEKTNSNVSIAVNANAAAASNLPPGLSGNRITVTNDSVPGINPKTANINLSNFSTPIPGITDGNAGKPMPKNTTIPGIPSEAELKRQMNAPLANRKIMENKPPVRESNSNMGPTDRPRRAGKP